MVSLNTKIAGSVLVIVSYAQAALASGKGCKVYNNLLPRNYNYRQHCEAETGPSGADPNWPCFTMWSGNLRYVVATANDGHKNPDDHFLIKDGYKEDFTTRDPSLSFNITFRQGWLAYTQAEPKGCSKIDIGIGGESADTDSRIWISDETNKERNADTEYWPRTGATVCTKWVHIHVK